MTQFDDRERAFEAKFAHDEEMQFRITARRNRLLGQWAARQMGLSEAETESRCMSACRCAFSIAMAVLSASACRISSSCAVALCRLDQ